MGTEVNHRRIFGKSLSVPGDALHRNHEKKDSNCAEKKRSYSEIERFPSDNDLLRHYFIGRSLEFSNMLKKMQIDFKNSRRRLSDYGMAVLNGQNLINLQRENISKESVQTVKKSELSCANSYSGRNKGEIEICTSKEQKCLFKTPGHRPHRKIAVIKPVPRLNLTSTNSKHDCGHNKHKSTKDENLETFDGFIMKDNFERCQSQHQINKEEMIKELISQRVIVDGSYKYYKHDAFNDRPKVICGKQKTNAIHIAQQTINKMKSTLFEADKSIHNLKILDKELHIKLNHLKKSIGLLKNA